MQGKGIIFLVILAILLQPMVGTVSAEYNGDNNHINYGTTNIVLIGQTLTFNDSDQGKMMIKKGGLTEARIVTGASDGLDSSLFPEEGMYFIDSDTSTPGGYDPGETILSVVNPIFSLKLKIGSLDVTEAPFITVGDTLTVEVLSNLDPANDLVSLKVIRQSDDAEIIIDGAGHHLRDRNISYLNSLHFDTSSLIPGGYEFYIETSNSGSQGLYLKSESISLVDNSPHQEGEENEDAGADYVEFLDDEPRSDLVIISSDGVVTLTIPGDMMVNDTQWSALESLKIVPIEFIPRR